jgi:hypothetical protein
LDLIIFVSVPAIVSVLQCSCFSVLLGFLSSTLWQKYILKHSNFIRWTCSVVFLLNYVIAVWVPSCCVAKLYMWCCGFYPLLDRLNWSVYLMQYVQIIYSPNCWAIYNGELIPFSADFTLTFGHNQANFCMCDNLVYVLIFLLKYGFCFKIGTGGESSCNFLQHW